MHIQIQEPMSIHMPSGAYVDLVVGCTLSSPCLRHYVMGLSEMALRAVLLVLGALLKIQDRVYRSHLPLCHKFSLHLYFYFSQRIGLRYA